MVAQLIVLLAISFSALAAESGPTPEQQADWQQRLEHAASLQAEGKAQQAAADKALADRTAECAHVFLVNGCRAKAESDHVAPSQAARRLENEGKALERAVRKEQLIDKDQRRAETAPQREANLQARQAETAESRQAAADQEAATRADKAKKAEAGSKRKAAEAEKQRKKIEQHEAKVAQKKRDAERRAAEGKK